MNTVRAIRIGTASVPLQIGASKGGGNFFNGAIDELALYDRALSAGEVRSIFEAGARGKCNSAKAPGGASR